MIEATDENNLDKYKSYIQRRRVSTEPLSDSIMNGTSALKNDKPQEETVSDEEDDDSDNDSYSGFSRYDKDFASSSVTALRRADPGLYQRLNGQNRRHSSSPYFSKYGSPYGSPGHGVEIQDNRTTVLAVKIIKQALACFMILGIIVLLQQKGENPEVLQFIKRNVVDIHIEPESILAGVENIVQETSRFLGGSP